MKEQLIEADIQCLALILAVIPGIPMSPESLAKLQAHELIVETPDGWRATDKGATTVATWGSEN